MYRCSRKESHACNISSRHRSPCSSSSAEAQTTTAITGARVIDGTGAPTRAETVIISGNHITAVSDHAEIPAGAHIVDPSGETFLPGLFDLHTHLNASTTIAVDDIGKSLRANPAMSPPGQLLQRLRRDGRTPPSHAKQ
jgi:predicted amidohydrolase YtcJ